MHSPQGRLYFWGESALYLGPDVSATVHAHHAVQVCIGLSGPLRLRAGPVTRWARGAGAVIPSNLPHETDVPVALIASLWVEPDTPVGQRLAPRHTPPRLLPIAPAKLAEIVPPLLTCWHQRCDARQAAAVTHRVLGALVAESRAAAVVDPRVARARALLQTAPDRRLALADLAAAVSLSPSRLAHLLRPALGMPARRYLLWLRLRDAIGELARGASITAAAHAAGFADAPHLDRTFRRMLGFTPSTALAVSQFVQDSGRDPRLDSSSRHD
jgi:AraC-like DNA-binding protein